MCLTPLALAATLLSVSPPPTQTLLYAFPGACPPTRPRPCSPFCLTPLTLVAALPGAPPPPGAPLLPGPPPSSEHLAAASSSSSSMRALGVAGKGADVNNILRQLQHCMLATCKLYLVNGVPVWLAPCPTLTHIHLGMAGSDTVPILLPSRSVGNPPLAAPLSHGQQHPHLGGLLVACSATFIA